MSHRQFNWTNAPLNGEMLNAPLASQPEDVAETIGQALEHPQGKVIVGSGAVAANLYRFPPWLDSVAVATVPSQVGYDLTNNFGD